MIEFQDSPGKTIHVLSKQAEIQLLLKLLLLAGSAFYKQSVQEFCIYIIKFSHFRLIFL